MDWLRWHHGTANDPKWRVIAKISGVSIGNVIAIWSTLLESASQNAENRGTLSGWNPEDVGAQLDLETCQVEAVYNIMQTRTLAGNKLTAWDKRNPKREREDSSTERVQRHRALKQQEEHHETPCNTKSALEEIREEESRKEGKETFLAISSPMEPKYPPEFELFWQQSTRRGSKSEALTQWKKLMPDRGHIAAIHAGMSAWKLSEQWQDEKMQPHISRWLRRRGWEENVPKSSNGNGNGHYPGKIERPEPRDPDHEHRCEYCEVSHSWKCQYPETCGMQTEIGCPAFASKFNP